MNTNFHRRLLSEYLDGEIGLADKQILEEVLRQDPQLRAEYQAQRRLGLELSSAIPQVAVHPYRFRQRLAHTLDQRRSGFFTPQRAFTGAMAIALVVVGITFGLFIYQERMIGRGGFINVSEAQQTYRPARPLQHTATLVVEATPEAFYNRLLVEAQLGLTDPQLAARVMQQTAVLEGASCLEGQGLDVVVFAGKLPARAQLELSLAELQRLQAVADGLTGRSNPLALSSDGGLITQQQYLLSYPSGAQLPVELIFQ